MCNVMVDDGVARVSVCMDAEMAVVASLDLTAYLQVVSPPAYLGYAARYTDGRCRPSHNSASSNLLHCTPSSVQLTPSTCCNRVPPPSTDGSFRSRDTGATGTTGNRKVADSGESCETSEVTYSSSSSSSSCSRRSRTTQKRVWFADDEGLQLVTVRRYDAAPPPAADDDDEPWASPTQQTPDCRRGRVIRLEPEFRQPWLDRAGLRARLDRDAVALVSACGRELALAGKVLVANVAYEKRVTVRCTVDCWRSFVDVDAAYVNRCRLDGADLFAFEVSLPDAGWTGVGSERAWTRRRGGVPVGRCEFAVRYRYREHSDAAWTERWDNKEGENYKLLAIW